MAEVDIDRLTPRQHAVLTTVARNVRGCRLHASAGVIWYLICRAAGWVISGFQKG